MPRLRRRRPGFWPCLVCGAAIGALAIGSLDATPVAAQEKPPDRWTLPVQLRAQETEVWCWAATGQMTMEFLGTSVSQSEQANRAFRRDDCGRVPTPRPCIRGGEILLRPYGFSYDLSTTPLNEGA